MDMHNEMILEEYRANGENYEFLRNFVVSEIQDALNINGILVSALDSRIKTEKSLAGKLELKGYKYKHISDVTDIVGARIVSFYSDEVDKIAALIEQIFNIDWDNSVDKRKMLASDQFGYMSLHYVCRLPKKMYDNPEKPELNDIRFEIQIRTTLQHVWATAYHDTGYKSDIEVPKEYIRALNRLSGVLEIADEQFSSIIRDISEYRRKVRALIKEGNFDDLELNGDTFRSYVEHGLFDKLTSRIAAINRAEIEPRDSSAYLKIFKRIGCNTLGDVERLKNKYSDKAYQLAALQIGGTDLDIVSSTIGLQNLCITAIVSQGEGEYGLTKFFDILYGERPRNRQSAHRIMEQCKSINIC